MHYYLDLKKNKEGKHLLHSDYCIEFCSSYKKIGHGRDLKEYKIRQEALASAKSIYPAWKDMIIFCDSEAKNLTEEDTKVTDYVDDSKYNKAISKDDKLPLGCWVIVIFFVIMIIIITAIISPSVEDTASPPPVVIKEEVHNAEKDFIKASKAHKSGDIETALYWMNNAANNGHVNAQLFLGLIYILGDGVEQDYAKAVRWFRAAAEQGHAEGQFYLALRYSDGKGVAQNSAEAIFWMRQAAIQGHTDAQYVLDHNPAFQDN